MVNLYMPAFGVPNFISNTETFCGVYFNAMSGDAADGVVTCKETHSVILSGIQTLEHGLRMSHCVLAVSPLPC